MEEIIISNFVTDDSKTDEFACVILSKFTTREKLEILLFILKNHYPEFLNKNKSFISDCTSTIEFRNLLAHSKYFSK